MNEITAAICSMARRVALSNNKYPWLGEAVVDWLAVPIGNNIIKISYVYSSLMAIVPSKECLDLTEFSKEIRDLAGAFIVYTDKRLTQYERMFGPNKQAVFQGSREDWMAEIGAQAMMVKYFVSELVLKEKTGIEEDIVSKLASVYNDYRTNPEWFHRP
jgi:hypothetical protein